MPSPYSADEISAFGARFRFFRFWERLGLAREIPNIVDDAARSIRSGRRTDVTSAASTVADEIIKRGLVSKAHADSLAQSCRDQVHRPTSGSGACPSCHGAAEIQLGDCSCLAWLTRLVSASRRKASALFGSPIDASHRARKTPTLLSTDHRPWMTYRDGSIRLQRDLVGLRLDGYGVLRFGLLHEMMSHAYTGLDRPSSFCDGFCVRWQMVLFDRTHPGAFEQSTMRRLDGERELVASFVSRRIAGGWGREPILCYFEVEKLCEFVLQRRGVSVAARNVLANLSLARLSLASVEEHGSNCWARFWGPLYKRLRDPATPHFREVLIRRLVMELTTSRAFDEVDFRKIFEVVEDAIAA